MDGSFRPGEVVVSSVRKQQTRGRCPHHQDSLQKTGEGGCGLCSGGWDKVGLPLVEPPPAIDLEITSLGLR